MAFNRRFARDAGGPARASERGAEQAPGRRPGAATCKEPDAQDVDDRAARPRARSTSFEEAASTLKKLQAGGDRLRARDRLRRRRRARRLEPAGAPGSAAAPIAERGRRHGFEGPAPRLTRVDRGRRGGRWSGCGAAARALRSSCARRTRGRARGDPRPGRRAGAGDRLAAWSWRTCARPSVSPRRHQRARSGADHRAASMACAWPSMELDLERSSRVRSTCRLAHPAGGGGPARGRAGRGRHRLPGPPRRRPASSTSSAATEFLVLIAALLELKSRLMSADGAAVEGAGRARAAAEAAEELVRADARVRAGSAAAAGHLRRAPRPRPGLSVPERAAAAPVPPAVGGGRGEGL